MNQDCIFYIASHLDVSDTLPFALTCTTIKNNLQITNLRRYKADDYVEMAFKAVINNDLESIKILFTNKFFKTILYSAYAHIYLMAIQFNRSTLVEFLGDKMFFNRVYIYVPTCFRVGVPNTTRTTLFRVFDKNKTLTGTRIVLAGTKNGPAFLDINGEKLSQTDEPYRLSK